jgi:DNA (cytosine-5)-methyltransferase 1
LEIVDTKDFTYLMTYSFPCQDLSKAGKGAGMTKGDNTRSGLLWEVERILKECDELPQILLMENVPDVIGFKNIDNFNDWQLFLENLGYKNYHQLLNAKDYGIPQNRNRCFMISILGDYSYQFPSKKELELKLANLLEHEVDGKYYLSENQLENLKINKNLNCNPSGKGMTGKVHDGDVIPTLTTNKGEGIKIVDRCIEVGSLFGGKWDKINESCRRVYSDQGLSPTVHTMQGGNTEPKIVQRARGYNKGGLHNLSPTISKSSWENNNFVVCEERQDEGLRFFKDNLCGSLRTIDSGGDKRVIENNLRIRKLTPKECWRLMGFDDGSFNNAAKLNSNTQLYKQAGNSIVVNVLVEIFKELL